MRCQPMVGQTARKSAERQEGKGKDVAEGEKTVQLIRVRLTVTVRVSPEPLWIKKEWRGTRVPRTTDTRDSLTPTVLDEGRLATEGSWSGKGNWPKLT